ncbi:hypothetical protein SAMN03159428_03042 [Kosakonia radicincitans]|uniref:Uncharacterized protein n=1 Tax=Kosakonia radicincitans TaxID=283686 RepID=A0AAX2EVX1_9ENTR|nr:hypothetical protein SAMN03159514_03581 [Kosakonia radicincitans]SFT96958.1 hypothetical protein SAMN03159428_03042 [Kosakonia radicincitans]
MYCCRHLGGNGALL